VSPTCFFVLLFIDGVSQDLLPLNIVFGLLVAVFLALAFSLTIGFGESPNMLFFIVFGAMFFFYLAHWQAYVTGAIRFGR